MDAIAMFGEEVESLKAFGRELNAMLGIGAHGAPQATFLLKNDSFGVIQLIVFKKDLEMAIQVRLDVFDGMRGLAGHKQHVLHKGAFIKSLDLKKQLDFGIQIAKKWTEKDLIWSSPSSGLSGEELKNAMSYEAFSQALAPYEVR